MRAGLNFCERHVWTNYQTPVPLVHRMDSRPQMLLLCAALATLLALSSAAPSAHVYDFGELDSPVGPCLNWTHHTNCNTASMGSIKFITGCPCTSEPCGAAPGSGYTITIGFVAGEAATNVTAIVHAMLGGVKINFPLANPDACTPTGGNLTCPLVSGQYYEYHQALTVPSYAPPGVTVIIQWELLDQNNEDIWCFQEPVKTI